jgi:uncharacterized protein
MAFLFLLATLATYKGWKMAEKHAWYYFSGSYLTAADAIDRGDTQDLIRSVKGINIDAPGRDAMTLMWWAILNEKLAAVTTLAKLGSNVEGQPVNGLGYPLYIAFRQDDAHLLAAMLDGGLSPNLEDKDKTALLQQVISRGDDPFAAVRLLVSRGADINHRDSIGGTALTESVDVNRPDIAIYLLEKGANPEVQFSNGATFAYAVQVSIEHLQPSAPQPKISNYTLDDKGQPVVTEAAPPAPGLIPEGKEKLRQYEQLRQMMIERGVKFPPETPAQVRARLGQSE